MPRGTSDTNDGTHHAFAALKLSRLDRGGGQSLQAQVYHAIRGAIMNGSLTTGTRLPPTREYAELLGVARNTVILAIQRLKDEGYVEARTGDGTYVSTQASGFSLPAAGPRIKVRAAMRDVEETELSVRGQRIAQTSVSWEPRLFERRPFRIGEPATDVFPFQLWERLSRETTDRTLRATAGYQHAAGHAPLRNAIAEFLALSRGIVCSAEQVLVTTGSQQGIDLACRMLLDEGDEVFMEDPCYLGTRANLLAHAARIVPVPVDAEGMQIGEARQAFPRARFAIVTPTHQFPLGVTMSLTRRLQMIAWARQCGGWILEDDYGGEFQYGERGIPALCSIDTSGRVIYVGTLSKILHPGIRLGFLVLPPGLVDAFTRAKSIADRHCPGQTQDILARFITEGHLYRHLRRVRKLYPQRQAVMIKALHEASGGRIALAPSSTGMHLTYEISGARAHDDRRLTQRAFEQGIEVAPLSAYCIESKRRGWAFGYAAYNDAEIRKAAQVIGRVLKENPMLKL